MVVSPVVSFMVLVIVAVLSAVVCSSGVSSELVVPPVVSFMVLVIMDGLSAVVCSSGVSSELVVPPVVSFMVLVIIASGVSVVGLLVAVVVGVWGGLPGLGVGGVVAFGVVSRVSVLVSVAGGVGRVGSAGVSGV